MIKSVVFIFLVLFVFCGFSFGQQLNLLQEGHDTSIRGLSVVDDSVAWISGSKGWTAHSTDRGMSWAWKQLPGYEKFDFRDIEAFSSLEAIAVSAGSPAVILYTNNGGVSWKEVYRNEHPEIFLDGMDFFTREKGLIFGDPIKSKMVLLRTVDGGKSWEDISELNSIPMEEGEAGFAASGTGIRTFPDGTVHIASGGMRSRLFSSSDFGATWKARDIPIIQGKNSTGPFSIAFYNKRTGIAAGGDYLQDTLRNNNLFLTRNGGKSWKAPKVSTGGYRSAVEYITKNIVLATGTSGIDISEDGGKNWKSLSKEGFHTVRKSKTGNWVLMTGNKGKIIHVNLNIVAD